MQKILVLLTFICLISFSGSFSQTAKPIGSGSPQTKQVHPKSPQQNSLPANPVAKIKTITIGDLVWAASNLNTSQFRNGDTIPNAKIAAEWKKAGEERNPAWCYYNNNPANGAKYGRLYNWFAVNDKCGLAPEGFAIPSESDWEKLKDFIGGVFLEGKLKSERLTLWKKESIGATNETGFSALPSGTRYHFGDFNGLGESCSFWSSTIPADDKHAYYFYFAGYPGNYGFGYTSPRMDFLSGWSGRKLKRSSSEL